MRNPVLALLFALAAPAALAQEADAPGLGASDAEVQRIHVVERRPFSETGRWEVTLLAPVQVNAKFTQHMGIAGELAWHARENLAVQVGGVWFPVSRQSSLSEELLSKADQVPGTASSFLVRGGAWAGLELTPIYGKLDVFGGRILRFGVYLDAALGAARTRLQLRPSTSVDGASYGDTGYRPMGLLGAGFRVFASERVTVRLELRDYAFSAAVSRINGCSAADVQRIADAPLAPQGLSGGCDARAFGNVQKQIVENAGAAHILLQDRSADVIHDLAVQGGISFLF